MKKLNKKALFIGISFLTTFIIWTILVCYIDVKKIGPQDSSVGFASINKYVHNITGSNLLLYEITDWLGLVPIFVAFGFAIFGLIQWIKRKKFLKVDLDILFLGLFYIITILAYILFETIVINYRPILINGFLESSYPSSTTLLVACVMPSAIIQFKSRIKNKVLKTFLITALWSFVIFMVLGRLISGVHWLTDIIGSLLFSVGIILIYYSTINLKFKKQK